MLKELSWVGSSRRDLRAFPSDVQDEIGRALLDVQFGDTLRNAKPLRGFSGASVMEIVEDDDGSAFRAVYTASFRNTVYVLHAFQKKSHDGIRTPRHEIEIIEKRFKAVLAANRRTRD